MIKEADKLMAEGIEIVAGLNEKGAILAQVNKAAKLLGLILTGIASLRMPLAGYRPMSPWTLGITVPGFWLKCWGLSCAALLKITILNFLSHLLKSIGNTYLTNTCIFCRGLSSSFFHTFVKRKMHHLIHSSY